LTGNCGLLVNTTSGFNHVIGCTVKFRGTSLHELL
jgi:hypothetical protein